MWLELHPPSCKSSPRMRIASPGTDRYLWVSNWPIYFDSPTFTPYSSDGRLSANQSTLPYAAALLSMKHLGLVVEIP
jgi:hypothetical protein